MADFNFDASRKILTDYADLGEFLLNRWVRREAIRAEVFGTDADKSGEFLATEIEVNANTLSVVFADVYDADVKRYMTLTKAEIDDTDWEAAYRSILVANKAKVDKKTEEKRRAREDHERAEYERLKKKFENA